MEEDDAEDVEDAVAVEVPATPEEAEWLEGLVKDASPLQTAQIQVNTLRIELAKVEEKIVLGGPATVLIFPAEEQRKEEHGAWRQLGRARNPASKG